LLGRLSMIEMVQHRLATTFYDTFHAAFDLHLQNIIPLHSIANATTKRFLNDTTLRAKHVNECRR